MVNGEPGNPYGLTRLRPGDRITIDAAGGGGYGNPLDRDPEMVERDVIEGYVSIENARGDYGVVVRPETMKIDGEATRKLRDELRRAEGRYQPE
jgi:N-methylhydantoinase B